MDGARRLLTPSQKGSKTMTLIEIINLLMQVSITFAVPAFAVAFKRYTGIQIEEKHQRAIHAALQSGAEAAVKNGPVAGLSVVTQAAMRHLYKSAPDAVASIPQAKQDVLETIATRFAAQAIAGIAKKAG